jgi:hypothetical protein
MPKKAFKDGYVAGWKWIRGSDEAPAILGCTVPDTEEAYREGVMCGVRDACALPQALTIAPDVIDNFLIARCNTSLGKAYAERGILLIGLQLHGPASTR